MQDVIGLDLGDIPIYHSDTETLFCFLEAVQRAAIFLLVAYVVGFVSGNHAKSLLQEEKRRTDELRKNEEKYRSQVESTEDSVYLVDQSCKYLFMNEKHLSRLGLAEGLFLVE